MSLLLHLSSVVVFFVLLHLLRRMLNERNFLRMLINAQRSGHKLCICPLVFVRRFATLFEIELQVQKTARLSPAMVNAQFFLDFYRQYGIQSMLVCINKDGNYKLNIKTITKLHDASELSFPAGVFGKALAVEVSG